MVRPEMIIDRKLAGYFSPASHHGGPVERWLAPAARSALRTIHSLFDGVWLRGRLYLTRDALVFEVSRLGRTAYKHPDLMDWSIPLHEIDRIETRQGLAYQIVDVTDLKGETRSIRCFGSDALIDALERARRRTGRYSGFSNFNRN